jgi:DNA invertase Pin-like site-specific DNA recombinase
MKGKKMVIIGYIRVSSNKQMLEHQEFEIKNLQKLKTLKLTDGVKKRYHPENHSISVN